MLLTQAEMENIGLASLGRDVRITRHALFFNPGKISIGDRTRIDAFAIVSAGSDGVTIGNNVHLAAYVLVNGSGGAVRLEDFSNIAPHVCLWTTSDDYTGGSLTNGTIPAQFKLNTQGPVKIGRHVIIGTSSVVLPNVHLHEGASVGALSMVTKDVSAGDVVCGCPAKKIKSRSVDTLREYEQAYLATLDPKHS